MPKTSSAANPRRSLSLFAPRERPFIVLATFFGLGRLPKAPGTWGTLGALPVWYLVTDLAWSLQLAIAAALTAFAIWVSARAEAIFGGHDNQQIVIDEVAGFMWCVIGVPLRPFETLVAFIAFRLLDALKPGPIGWVDRNVAGGAGVVLDDVAAGVVGCALMWSIWLYLGGWL